MVTVIISGMPAVGKTTVAKQLAERFGLSNYCGGDVLRELASERGFKPNDEDWWDTPDGLKFLAERRMNPEFDRSIDRRLTEIAKKGDVVISSYTLPWLVNEGVKIWLKASAETRAKRMAKRDCIPYLNALEVVRSRDLGNRELYSGLYGINFGEDLSVFHFVIDTENLSKTAVEQILSAMIEQCS